MSVLVGNNSKHSKTTKDKLKLIEGLPSTITDGPGGDSRAIAIVNANMTLIERNKLAKEHKIDIRKAGSIAKEKEKKDARERILYTKVAVVCDRLGKLKTVRVDNVTTTGFMLRTLHCDKEGLRFRFYKPGISIFYADMKKGEKTKKSLLNTLKDRFDITDINSPNGIIFYSKTEDLDLSSL